MNISGIDYLIISVYLLITIALGIYFSKKALRSVNDYFVTGRILPWWLAGFSMIASAFAIDTPLGITGMVAKNGISGVWYAWSFVLGGAGALGAFIFSAMLRRSEIITIPELIELRYEGKPAAFLRGFKGVYFGILANSITLGWVIKAVWTIAKTVFPNSAQTFAVFLGINIQYLDLILISILLFTLFYTYFSGLWGIAVTDVVQFIIGSIGTFTLAYFAIKHIGGVEQIEVGFIEKYGEVAAGDRLSFFPKMGTPFFVTFVVFLTLKWWGNPPPAITQRIISSKNEKHASFATMFFAVVAFGINYWPMIIAALVSIIVYPNLPLAQAESGYAKLIVDLLPSGFLGLMLAAMIAAFMSTIDTHINYGASFMVNDIYRRFIKRDGSEKHYVKASQISTVLIMVIAVVIAYNLDSVSQAWYFMAMLTSGYGFLVVARWFWWRINAYSEISALSASGIGSLLLSPKFASLLGYKASLPSYGYRFVIVFFTTTAVWLIVSFLTKPVSEEKLVSFCRKVKPFNFLWGPIKENYPDIDWTPNFRRAAFNWLLGAIAIYSISFGIGSLIFARNTIGLILILLATVSIIIILRNLKLKDSC